jgi:hypothetical protein
MLVPRDLRRIPLSRRSHIIGFHDATFSVVTEDRIRGPALENAKRLLPLRSTPLDAARAQVLLKTLLALRRTVSELGSISRNLRCTVGVGDIPAGQRDLRNAQRVCAVLRDDIRALIKANARSWDLGDVADRDAQSR